MRHAILKFDSRAMTVRQRDALQRAERALFKAGVRFDTSNNDTRNWHLDWTLTGPVALEVTEDEENGK